jgi:mannose-1-phosphate guanylyltransferase
MKIVTKPWGYEHWIADGIETPYAVKRILFRSGFRTSLQVHEKKFETNYVLSGHGILLRSDVPINIESFLRNGMSVEQVDQYENTMTKIELVGGTVFNVAPGYVHRVIAISDLEFMETSTSELDDVIRLQDDSGRPHGKILSEHTETDYEKIKLYKY